MIFSKRQKVQSFDDEELDIDEAYKLKKKEDPSKMRCSLKLLIIMIALFIIGVFIKLNDYKGDQILEDYSFTTCPQGKYSNRNQCQFCNYKCQKCTDVYGLCIQCEKGYQSDYQGVCKKNLEKEILIKEYNNIPFYLNVGQQQDYFFIILQDNIFDTQQYNQNYTFITVDTYNLILQKGQIIDGKFINKTLAQVDLVKKQNFTNKILISYGCKQQQAFRILQKSKIFDQLFLINPNDQDCDQYIQDDLINQYYQPFKQQKIIAQNLNYPISYLYSNEDDCKNNSKRLLMQNRILETNEVKGNSSNITNSTIQTNQTDQTNQINKTDITNSTNSTNPTNSTNSTITTNSSNSSNPNNQTNQTDIKSNTNETIVGKNLTQNTTNDNKTEGNKTENNQTQANNTQDKNQTNYNITNAEENKNNPSGKISQKEDKETDSEENDSEENDSEENDLKSDKESEQQAEDRGSSEESLEEKPINIKCYQLNDNTQSGQSLLDQISQIIKNQIQN